MLKRKYASYDIRREFVGANKQTNRASPSLSQQAPLVAKAHLMAVVRRVEQKERTKGKQLGEFVFKNLPQSRGKNLRADSAFAPKVRERKISNILLFAIMLSVVIQN